MRLEDAMAAIATGDAKVVDVTDFTDDNQHGAGSGGVVLDEDYERQVALG